MIGELARRFPKWALAVAIAGGSSVFFYFWWNAKKRELASQSQPPAPLPAAATTIDGEREPAAAPGEPIPVPAPAAPAEQDPIEIDPATMFLGSDSLYRISDSGVELVAAHWLNSPIHEGTRVMLLEEEGVLVVKANHQFFSYDLNGKLLGALWLTSRESFDGYLTPDLSEGIYVKQGDLWRGKIDWKQALVTDEKQITNLGYFQGSPLRGRLISATGKALLYRDVRLGLIWVNLETGETSSGQLPTEISTSPDRKLVVGQVLTRPPAVAVFNTDTKELAQYPVERLWPRNQGLAWLNGSRVALALGAQIVVYDHETKSMAGIYQNPSARASIQILTASPDGKLLLIADSVSGLQLLNTTSGKAEAVPTGNPTSGIEWLGNNTMFLVVDVADTNARGTWFFREGESDSLKRVYAQPLYARTASGKPGYNVSKIFFDRPGQTLFKAFGRWSMLDIATSKLQDVSLDEKALARLETSP